MTGAGLEASLASAGLAVLAIADRHDADPVPAHVRSIALIGPNGPAFWDVFARSEEFRDGALDPLDRWSRRVIGTIAAAIGADPFFPFGGPPWMPFIAWAERSDRVFTAPVGLLVHAEHGLMVSFRGALGLRERLEPVAARPPCDSCAGRPCLNACPPGALTAAGYDVPACHQYLDTPAGAECLGGCRVRAACPVGADLRPEAQSAFHMAAFHGPRR